MKTEWFAPLIREWGVRRAWKTPESERAAHLLAQISRANGGDLVEAPAGDDRLAAGHAARRASDALQRWATLHAPFLQTRHATGRGADGAHEYVPPGWQAFTREPTFTRYVQLVLAAPGSDGEPPHAERSLPQRVLQALEHALAATTAHPFPHQARVRTVDLVAARRAASRVGVERRQRAAPVDAANLLRDRDYARFLRPLIRNARKSVSIVMFYLKHEGRTSYPTHSLVEDLKRLHRRGRRVRVILDRDREGDVYRSRAINRSALEELRRAGVPVRTDSEAVLTHAKVVVVDGRHVVLGSHNWTAGSFAVYDETSVHLESPKLGSEHERRFHELWSRAT